MLRELIAAYAALAFGPPELPPMTGAFKKGGKTPTIPTASAKAVARRRQKAARKATRQKGRR